MRNSVARTIEQAYLVIRARVVVVGGAFETINPLQGGGPGTAEGGGVIPLGPSAVGRLAFAVLAGDDESGKDMSEFLTSSLWG